MKRELGVLAVTLLLGGCTLLSPPHPAPQHTFVLDAHVTEQVATDRVRDVVLQLNPLLARPGYDTRAMVYTERAHELQFFADNRWAAPPVDMLLPLMAEALERSCGIHAVFAARGATAADLRLDGELVRLLQDFGSRPSHVEFVLRVQLIDVGSGRVLAAREFGENEAATSDDPYGGALAAGRALSRVLVDLGAFCATQVAP